MTGWGKLGLTLRVTRDCQLLVARSASSIAFVSCRLTLVRGRREVLSPSAIFLYSRDRRRRLFLVRCSSSVSRSTKLTKVRSIGMSRSVFSTCGLRPQRRSWMLEENRPVHEEGEKESERVNTCGASDDECGVRWCGVYVCEKMSEWAYARRASWLSWLVSAESTSGVVSSPWVTRARARVRATDPNLARIGDDSSSSCICTRVCARAASRSGRNGDTAHRRWLMWSCCVPLATRALEYYVGCDPNILKMEVVYIGTCVRACIFIICMYTDMSYVGVWVCCGVLLRATGFFLRSTRDHLARVSFAAGECKSLLRYLSGMRPWSRTMSAGSDNSE